MESWQCSSFPKAISERHAKFSSDFVFSRLYCGNGKALSYRKSLACVNKPFSENHIRRKRIEKLLVMSSALSNAANNGSAERQVLFNNISPVYDQLNDVLSLGQHRIWKRMAVSWSCAGPGDTVLDICCGSGDIALLLAKKVGQKGSVVGLDFAAEQLAVASKRQKDAYVASSVDMRWIEGDALKLPFNDNEFDAVTMGYGLRNVVDIPRSLRETLRVLKPGKKAAILDFNNSTDPFVSTLQGFMLDNVVVPVARQLGVGAEYEYLRPSIQRFPTGKEQVSLALSAGFKAAVHYEIGGGLMGVLVLQKPE